MHPRDRKIENGDRDRRADGRLHDGREGKRAGIVMAAALSVAALLALGPGARGTSADSGAVAVAHHGARNAPTIALTIDDGYNAANCRTVVDILERRHVVATFFPASKWIPLDPALWRRIASLGFPIGNHTAHHDLLSKLTLDEQVAEIDQGKREIEAAIGEPIIPVLRPPGGDWDAATPIAAGRTGARLVLLWDTTFADTSTDGVLQHYIDRATAGIDGSVILLHCGPDITPKVLEPAIDFYEARGFTFVTVPQMFGLPGPVPTFEPAAAPSPVGTDTILTAPPSPAHATPAPEMTAAPAGGSTEPSATAEPSQSPGFVAIVSRIGGDPTDEASVALLVLLAAAFALAVARAMRDRRRRVGAVAAPHSPLEDPVVDVV